MSPIRPSLRRRSSGASARTTSVHSAHFTSGTPTQTTAPVFTVTSPPNIVEVQLSTSIVISHYSDFYHDVPIASFPGPQYHALVDGSLVAPPLIQATRTSYITLFVAGLLSMLFISNVFTSISYIQRTKRLVQKKALFYILLLSQIMAPISFAMLLVGYFDGQIDCKWYALFSFGMMQLPS
jgi:hypothetical protein